jgi:hypothetical protein
MKRALSVIGLTYTWILVISFWSLFLWGALCAPWDPPGRQSSASDHLLTVSFVVFIFGWLVVSTWQLIRATSRSIQILTRQEERRLAQRVREQDKQDEADEQLEREQAARDQEAAEQLKREQTTREQKAAEQLKREQAVREREAAEHLRREEYLRKQEELQAVRESAIADALSAPTYEECLEAIGRIPLDTCSGCLDEDLLTEQEATDIRLTPELRRHLKSYFIIPTRAMIEVEEEDYERNNEVDREFLKKYKLKLINHFGCKCAVCGADNNGIHIDHYFIPKARGGNFVLRLTDGRRIVNAVPMCESCNCSKGKRTIEPDMEIVKKLAEFQKMM